MSKVWFKQDDKFFLPKACLNFEFFRYVQHKDVSVKYNSAKKLIITFYFNVRDDLDMF